jgi:hypothetical protein
MRSALLPLCLSTFCGCLSVWTNPSLSGPKMRTLGRQPPGSDATPQRASDRELRLRIERFADEFMDGVEEPLTAILVGKQDIRRRMLALSMLYTYDSTALTIASGAHPSVAVLDMVVFVTLTRDTLERWGSEELGPRNTEMLLERFRRYEADIWGIAGSLITPAQEQTLRELLAEWRENYPDQKHVENIRFGEFVDELDLEDRPRAQGLLASVRQAAVTADDALDLGERLTFFFQRAPFIWRLHAQLAFFEIMSQPETQGLLVDAARISASIEQFASNVDRLSTLLIEGARTPEDAAFFENLAGGEAQVRALLSDVRATMREANALAASVDGLAVRFDVGAPLAPGEKPFDIADYEPVAAQVTATTHELSELMGSLNQLLASPAMQDQLPSAVDQAQARSEEFVRYLVILALVIIFSSIMGTFGAVLGYRYLAARLDARLERAHRLEP